MIAAKRLHAVFDVLKNKKQKKNIAHIYLH